VFLKRIQVNQYERVLIARNDRLRRILMPGRYWFIDTRLAPLQIERHDVRDLIFRSRWTNDLIKNRPDLLDRLFVVVRTNRVQVAMIYVDGVLFKVLPPVKRLVLWNGAAHIRAELVNVIAEPATLFDNIRLPELTNSS
jgi:hypothetical protein